MARQTSFRERTLRTTRRRRRLSVELAFLIEREFSSEIRKFSFSESLTESGERYLIEALAVHRNGMITVPYPIILADGEGLHRSRVNASDLFRI